MAAWGKGEHAVRFETFPQPLDAINRMITHKIGRFSQEFSYERHVLFPRRRLAPCEVAPRRDDPAVTPVCADAEAVTATNKNGVLTTIPRNTPAQSPAKPIGPTKGISPPPHGPALRLVSPRRSGGGFLYQGIVYYVEASGCKKPRSVKRTGVSLTLLRSGGTPLPHARLRVVSLHHEVFPSR